MRPRGYGADSDVSLLGVGTAHAVAEAAGDKPAGRLIVPEAESRTGWRDYYVPQRGLPTDRLALGFRKPGDR